MADMPVMDETIRPADYEREARELERLLPALGDYQRLAARLGIFDIFQDNGGKTLQILLRAHLHLAPGRHGFDAVDGEGRGYEIKSLNRLLVSGFSTHHHLGPGVIEHYRGCLWAFAVFAGIDLERIYTVAPSELEPCFERWERRLIEKNTQHLNNPKIPLRLVEQTGRLIYPLA